MSSLQLYRNPTWAGMIPGLPVLSEVRDELTPAVCRAVGKPGSLHALSYGGKTCAHYLFKPQGSAPLFVKVVPELRRESLVRADGISCWLAHREISVIPVLQDFPKPLEPGVWLFVYPFVDGVRPEATVEDLAALGRELARLHAALAQHECRSEWQQATSRRLARLLEIRTELAAGSVVAGPRPDTLRDLARNDELDFVASHWPATPLHDDLHPGNLLKDAQTGVPVFLDFEDVFHGVLPTVFELGLVIERMILVRVPHENLARELAQAFLDAYRVAGGSVAAEAICRLANVMLSRCLRSLCVIVDCERSGIPIVRSEWDKFFRLIQLTSERVSILSALR